jgi:hypothetical protein
VSEDGGSLNIASVLGLDVNPFTSGMSQVTSVASVFPSVVTSFMGGPLLGLIDIASSAASAIKSAFLDVAASADNAGESAQKLGVSTEFLTGMGRAAADAGASMDSFQDALKFVNKNAAEAAGGSKEVQAAFASIGVSVKDASGNMKGTEALWAEVAAGINAIPDASTKTQTAMQLMGRSGTEMIAALGSMNDLQPIFKQLGANIDEGLAASGDKFGTLQTIAGAALDGLKNSLARPILDTFAGNFDEIVGRITSISSAMMPAFASIGEAVGPLIMPAIDIITNLAQVVGPTLSAAFQTLGPIMAGAMSIFRGVSAVLASYGPAIQEITPIFAALGKVIGTIMDGIGAAIGAAAALATSVRGALGFGMAELAGAGVLATAAGGGGGGRASTTYNVENHVYVPPVDQNEATSKIASKVAPAIRDAVDRQRDQMDAIDGAEATRRGL